ncbi:SAP30-binding protein-like [Neltuma alba]|uniref:SAP30-binding protein-like n=1 Tax=Neltuma alba TaxID=207710 RepID=UPI0010A49355|nr:SAP30-binding protein-like [Prosopis alba]
MQVDAVAGSDGAEHEETAQEEQKFVDPLDRFLPPPPKVKCSECLQRKINKFLEYKKAGKSFNATVRNRKDYRNPDFLLHAVRCQDIDQIGSCFDKDVLDPHRFDPSDYYDQIGADMRRGSDKKELEKKAQKVEFVSRGAQPGIVTGVPRINVPVAGIKQPSGLPLMPPTAEATNRDGRLDKKSKWDEVDGDQKNPLPFVGQDSVPAHAAILLLMLVMGSKNDERQRREGQLKGRKEGDEPHSFWSVKLIPPTILKSFRLPSTKMFVYSCDK